MGYIDKEWMKVDCLGSQIWKFEKKFFLKNLSFFKNCNKNDGFFVTKKVFFPLFSK